jgi:hypothetical protein
VGFSRQNWSEDTKRGEALSNHLEPSGLAPFSSPGTYSCSTGIQAKAAGNSNSLGLKIRVRRRL